MRGLPGWMILGLVALTALMLYVGWIEREHVGPLPFILGIVWAVFTVACMGAKARHGFSEEH
jgi:hypothetical protein